MQVKSIVECPKGSILQYFGPQLNYHLSLRSLFCLFLSGRFTQVLHVQRNIILFAIITCDLSMYTIDHPALTESNYGKFHLYTKGLRKWRILLFVSEIISYIIGPDKQKKFSIKL